MFCGVIAVAAARTECWLGKSPCQAKLVPSRDGLSKASKKLRNAL